MLHVLLVSVRLALLLLCGKRFFLCVCVCVFTITMPSASLDFRAICGSFVFTYIGFMYRRAKFRLTTRVRVLTASSRLKGVMVGLILTVFFTEDLLLRCGDVERNPGQSQTA